MANHKPKGDQPAPPTPPTPPVAAPPAAPTAPTNGPIAAKIVKVKTSERLWLDTAAWKGAVPTGDDEVFEEKATRGVYVLEAAFTGTGAPKVFEYTPSAACSPKDRMCAIKGWHTHLGNLVNSWKTDVKKGAETAPTPLDAIETWEMLVSDPTNPQWQDRSPSTGPRLNMASLAQCVLDTAGGGAATISIRGQVLDAAGVKLLLETDKSQPRSFLDVVRSNADTMTLYRKRQGLTVTSVSDLLSF